MRRLFLTTAVVIAIIAAVAALVVFVPGPRSLAVRSYLQIELAKRGYHFSAESLAIGAHEIDAGGVIIADSAGVPLISANHVVIDYAVSGLFGRTDRAYGLHSILVRSPVINIVRPAHGTFNAASLIARLGTCAAPVKPRCRTCAAAR